MSEHYRALERMYHGAPVNEFHQPRLEVAEGTAVVHYPLRPEFLHAAGAMHGALMFKGLDDAAFFAVNSLVEEFFVLTTSFTVYFTRPVAEGPLRAEGRVVSRSRNLFVAEAVLFEGEQREVARGSGTFMKSTMRLSETPGYRIHRDPESNPVRT